MVHGWYLKLSHTFFFFLFLDLSISSVFLHFFSVFNVKHRNGNKVKDEGVISYIKKVCNKLSGSIFLCESVYRVFNTIFLQVLESDTFYVPSLESSVGLKPSLDYTSIELAGADRPGLLSEVCAVLADLSCNVVSAEIWTHNARAAAVVNVTDDMMGCAIEDPERLLTIKNRLCNVFKGNNDLKTAKMTLSPPGSMHRERRLHQMMFADRDYENAEQEDINGLKAEVSVLDCMEKDYTVITMRCKDRPKLLFDTICTITDMQYVVYHGVVYTGKMEAYQV